MVVALTSAACTPVSPYAAVVNGQVISQQDLMVELTAIAHNPAFVKQLQSGSQPLTIQGQVPKSFATSFVDLVLSRQISFALVHQELVRRHVLVGPSDLALARNDAVSSVGGPTIFDAFPRTYQEALVRDSAELTALQSSLAGISVGPAALHRFYDTHRSIFTESCISVIVVATAAQAAGLRARIAKGASFTHLAETVSADPVTRARGGQLGCGLPAAFANQLGPQFAGISSGLAVGQVSPPVQTQVGFVLAKVTAKRLLPFSQATPAIRGTLLGGANDLLVSFIGHLVRQAKVSVDPRYGRFSMTGTMVGLVPPAAPPARDLVLPDGYPSQASTGLPGNLGLPGNATSPQG